MNKEDVIVFGAGGHGKSVLDVLLSGSKYSVVAFAEKNTKKDECIYGIPIVDENIAGGLNVKNAIVSIGDNAVRKKVFKKLRNEGYSIINAISHLAYVSPYAEIGCGVVVMPFSVVSIGARVGNGAIINTKASIDHDTIIGDFCHIAPGSTLCGYVDIGAESFIGAGSTIIDRITVGEKAVVGAGAVVNRDVLARQTVVGVPAKLITN